MAPNIFGIWTPRNSSPRRFRAWTHTPNIQEYTSPPTPKQLPTPKSRRTISTDLDEAAVAELTTQAQAWRKEAAKLEKEAAAMVESQDTAEMGVATVAGQARLDDRAPAQENQQQRVEEIRQKAENLQRRARAADAAVDAYRAANRTADELQKLTSNFDSHIELQLGALLAQRNIKASDLVGMWQGPRASAAASLRPAPGSMRLIFPWQQETDHRHELTRSEFNNGVAKLGFRVNGQPVSSQAISKLFDLIYFTDYLVATEDQLHLLKNLLCLN